MKRNIHNAKLKAEEALSLIDAMDVLHQHNRGLWEEDKRNALVMLREVEVILRKTEWVEPERLDHPSTRLIVPHYCTKKAACQMPNNHEGDCET